MADTGENSVISAVLDLVKAEAGEERETEETGKVTEVLSTVSVNPRKRFFRTFANFVGIERFELSQTCVRSALNAVCLPVPPYPRSPEPSLIRRRFVYLSYLLFSESFL